MKGDRIGEVKYNNQGSLMKIIKDNGVYDIIVEFQDKYKAKVKCRYCNFERGGVKNPYYPYVFNVGYIGQGKYTHKTHKEIYQKWHQMIKRCYDPHYLNRKPTYRDVFVCDEWLCFQNFAKWYENNYYKCNNEIMELDKDILVKGSKIYSPKTCCFVPRKINSLFIKQKNNRGKYPIGITDYYDKKGYNYLIVQCNTLEKQEYLGTFPLSEPFHAFYTYKQFKENYIKQVADEYKDIIPQRLYDAMYKYEVDITD